MLRSKLRVKDAWVFLASAFYASVGATCFTILANDPRLIHIGLIGILNLVTAYGLFKKRAWSLWAVVALFLITLIFSTSMFYALGKDPLIDAGVVTHFTLTSAFTFYIMANRKAFRG